MHQPNGMEFSTTCLATDLRVHYAEQGNPTGGAVIFHHAYVDSWFSYSRVLSLQLGASTGPAALGWF
jgi:hypothetical protein